MITQPNGSRIPETSEEYLTLLSSLPEEYFQEAEQKRLDEAFDAKYPGQRLLIERDATIQNLQKTITSYNKKLTPIAVTDIEVPQDYLKSRTQITAKCGNCGETVRFDTSFCPDCGHRTIFPDLRDMLKNRRR